MLTIRHCSVAATQTEYFRRGVVFRRRRPMQTNETVVSGCHTQSRVRGEGEEERGSMKCNTELCVEAPTLLNDHL